MLVEKVYSAAVSSPGESASARGAKPVPANCVSQAQAARRRSIVLDRDGGLPGTGIVFAAFHRQPAMPAFSRFARHREFADWKPPANHFARRSPDAAPRRRFRRRGLRPSSGPGVANDKACGKLRAEYPAAHSPSPRKSAARSSVKEVRGVARLSAHTSMTRSFRRQSLQISGG